MRVVPLDKKKIFELVVSDVQEKCHESITNVKFYMDNRIQNLSLFSPPSGQNPRKWLEKRRSLEKILKKRRNMSYSSRKSIL